MSSASMSTHPLQIETTTQQSTINKFPIPSKFDIIRSNSKDKYYLYRQLDTIKSILSSFPGTSALSSKFNDELKLTSDLIYYTLTTLLNRQTLGEECYYLVQFNRENIQIPSRLARVLMILLRVTVPYTIKKISNLKNMDLAQMLLVIMNKFNYLVFLFSSLSTYLNLENRLTKINYLSLNFSEKNLNRKSIKLIAFFKSINLIVYGISLAKMALKQSNMPSLDDKLETKMRDKLTNLKDEDFSNATKCSICLERLKNATLTSCGHLYCWDCIQKYAINLSNNSSDFSSPFNCPSCRVLIKIDKLVFLNNY